MKNTSTIKLTSLSHKGGCGCKIGPKELQDVLQDLPPSPPNNNVLVGLDTSDDAGIYKLSEELAMVQTLDFFTPIVDDPYDFGQVAAANAVSDVYAMGGTPVTALNIVAFPITQLEKSILSAILEGAKDKLSEANIALVGGHSIDDEEPKFGLSVTGTIHPEQIRTNTGAKPGDKLLLTKPIGVGIMTSSLKKGLLSADEIQAVTKVMTTLNKTAMDVSKPYEIHASTDVTGFGLLGHLTEIAQGSNVGIQVDYHSVPVLPRVRELAEAGHIPGGSKSNYQYVKNRIHFADALQQIDKWILTDAVTSGGLLLSVRSEEAASLEQELRTNGVNASIIGEVTTNTPGEIRVTT